MNELIRQQKRRQLQMMLEGGLVMVHVDPRADGVTTPPQFSNDAVLRLNIAYGFNLPALTIDSEGVYVILSFSGRDFPCNLPWDAVFAMTAPDNGHEGVVWPESVPPELAPFIAEAGLNTASVPINQQPRGARVAAEGMPVEPNEDSNRPTVSEESLAVAEAMAEELVADRYEATSTVPASKPPIFVVHDGGRGSKSHRDDSKSDEDGSDGDTDGPPTEPRSRPALTVVKS